MNYNKELEQLEFKLNSLTSEVSSLTGKCELLGKQIENSNTKLIDLAHKREVYRKSVELLTLVQKATKDKIKEGFENIISHALKYIYSEDYSFELEFGRRGNLSEVDFNIKTSDFKLPFDPKETSGGGVLDILSLALRITLLELSKPKIEGFLILDEPYKHLSSEYLGNARNFLDAINKRMNRQIIVITHKRELITSNQNVIEIK